LVREAGAALASRADIVAKGAAPTIRQNCRFSVGLRFTACLRQRKFLRNSFQPMGRPLRKHPGSQRSILDICFAVRLEERLPA
jgi:hypothetical protein